MENSHIEWTDHTFNPWIGCTKVSPGCEHCYAEARDQRFAQGKHWGKGAPRQRTSAANWREPLKWDRTASWTCCGYCEYNEDDGSLSAKCVECSAKRPRVFCASLADWLDDEVPIEWTCNLLETVHACQNLDWQMLTKRPANWQTRIEQVLRFAAKNENPASRDADRHDEFFHWLNLWINAHVAPANIWLGTTVEDQVRADERIPKLLEIPAKVRFLSCEPLLEAINLKPWLTKQGYIGCFSDRINANPRLHWVICGGESGPGARPMHPEWARSLRDQCVAAEVPFFFKASAGARLPAVVGMESAGGAVMKALTDLDPMPFGKHKGVPMQDVPAAYLVWLKEQGCSHPGVRGYIEASWSAIKSECPDHIFEDD